MRIHPAAQKLEQRLKAVAASLAQRESALGLLALGSVGQELERADAWSDLDFFVLVRPGAKADYLHSLDWLEIAHPLAWHFANTPDGHKAWMADGILCEFAVFEPHELLAAKYTPGRWIWRRESEVPVDWATPRVALPQAPNPDWLLNEALSNLLVGLQRYHRGERLAAMRMVQVYALDRVLEWTDLHEASEQGVRRDPFSVERRFEARHPARAASLQAWAPGIDATPQAAAALMEWVGERLVVPEALVAKIRRFLQAQGKTVLVNVERWG